MPVQYLAAVRSKADVERYRDVIRERRIEDIDGSLLILEEAVDLRLGERPIGREVIVDLDLHGVFLALSQGSMGDLAQPTCTIRIAGFHNIVARSTSPVAVDGVESLGQI